MNASRTARLATLALGLAQIAMAQSPSMISMFGTNLKHSAGDAWAVWTIAVTRRFARLVVRGGSRRLVGDRLTVRRQHRSVGVQTPQ
jgi:hypothetical protein